MLFFCSQWGAGSLILTWAALFSGPEINDVLNWLTQSVIQPVNQFSLFQTCIDYKSIKQVNADIKTILIHWI